MRNKFILIISLSLAALLTLGCGVCSLISQKGRETTLTKVAEEIEKQLSATPEEKSTTTAQSATATPKPTATKKAEEPPASDTLGAVEQPTSYRYQLVLEMNEGDQVNKMNGEGAYVQDPPAYELNLESTENGETMTIHIIQVNNKLYFYDTERDGWMVLPAQEQDISEAINPNDLVKQEYLNAFKLQKKSETVNGQDCNVYQADAQDLSDSILGEGVEVTEGTVRVWVAKKLNMMVRYLADASGKKADGTAVRTRVQMDMFDLNKTIQIEPPPDDKILEDISNLETPTDDKPAQVSKGEAAKLPKPSDAQPLSAQDLETAKMMVTGDDYDIYQTKLTVAKAAEFLEKAYDEAGWSKESWSTVTDDMAMLFFTQGDQTAQVTISGQLIDGIIVVIVSIY